MRHELRRRARVWTLGGLLLGGSIGLPIPGLAAPGASPCGPLDVALVLDVTASMAPAIANVRTESAHVLGAIERASGGNYRVALVTFRDDVTVNASFAPRNRASVEHALRQLDADGGEDEPEASDAALETVIDSLAAGDRPQQGDFSPGFRDDARKLVLLVTDARPGSFDDTFVAGVHDARAHQHALDARAKGIAISAVYTATDESQPYQETIRRIM